MKNKIKNLIKKFKEKKHLAWVAFSIGLGLAPTLIDMFGTEKLNPFIFIVTASLIFGCHLEGALNE